MTRLSTVLWFAGEAEQAAAFYAHIFGGQPNLTVRSIGEGPIPRGDVAGVGLDAGGQSIVALNAPPGAPFPMGGAMMAGVADQAELDRVWDALLEGGQPMMCGWLKDRFGVSWQIVPNDLGEMLADSDVAAATRVTRAMFSMIRLDIAALHAAFKGETQ